MTRTTMLLLWGCSQPARHLMEMTPTTTTTTTTQHDDTDKGAAGPARWNRQKDKEGVKTGRSGLVNFGVKMWMKI